LGANAPRGLRSLSRTLWIAEFMNDGSAGDWMEGKRIHIMVREEKLVIHAVLRGAAVLGRW
jgi:hypothetical protein